MKQNVKESFSPMVLGKKLLLLFLLIQQQIVAQPKNEWTNRFSVKLAYSFSITQYGPSPFSSTRPARRGISSALLNIQYEQPITPKWKAAIGVQLAEKGMKLHYTLVIPGVFEQYDRYERRLHYIETPLTVAYNTKRFKLIAGMAASYLYSHDLRYQEKIITYDQTSGVVKEIDESEFAIEDLADNYHKWDVGGIIGMSYQLMNSLDIEVQAQKQFIQANNLFPNSKDIAYSLTLSLGLRYRFL